MEPGKYDVIIFLVVTTVVILVLAIMVIYFIFSHSKKQLLHVQTINKLNLDHEKSLMTAKLEMQELTFRHISREIHDNVTLSLSVSKMNMNKLNSIDKKDEEKVITSIELISKSIDDLRHLSKTLDSDVIKRQGLITMLEKEMDRLSISGEFTIETDISENLIAMDPEKELLIFRIAQETFNNIIKHSQATVIIFSLRYYSHYVELNIKDNGIGFDYPVRDSTNMGTGLENIIIRTKTLNGKASIISAPGQGTTVNVSIPYE